MMASDEKAALTAPVEEATTGPIQVLSELQSIISGHVESLQESSINVKSLLAEYAKIPAVPAEVKAAGPSKNPYVLTLIDAHSHQFADEVFRKKGAQAAGLLAAAISKQVSLSRANRIDYRVKVRLYADLKTLSQIVSKTGHVGAEPYSLAPFTASFSASSPFFDFVDVGSKKAIHNKISELTRAALNDTECQQLILGSSHAAILDIVTQNEQSEKVTIIQAGGHEISHLYPHIREARFPDIFRDTNLDGTLDITAEQVQSKEITPLRPEEVKKMTDTSYGCSWKQLDTGVTKRDAPKSVPGNQNTRSSDAIYSHKGKQNMNVKPPKENKRNHNIKGTPKIAKSPKYSAVGLPTTHLPGLIPLNASGQRLDIILSLPKKVDIDKHISFVKKPCNRIVMDGTCRRSNCPFDHTPLTDAIAIGVIAYLHKCYPCRYGSHCRKIDCYYGHICQRSQCSKGRVTGCRMDDKMHKVDKNLAGWIDPDQKTVKLTELSAKDSHMQKKFEAWARFAGREAVKQQKQVVWGGWDGGQGHEEEDKCGFDSSSQISETSSSSSKNIDEPNSVMALDGHGKQKEENEYGPAVAKESDGSTTTVCNADSQREGLLIDLSED